jgi:hypothetical protein
LFRILSNRDNFRMTAADLANEGKEGRDAILSALKELRAVGYAATTRAQGPDGRWRTETVIFDVPQIPPSTEVGKPDFGLPDFGFPDPIQKYKEKYEQQHQAAIGDHTCDVAAALVLKEQKRKSPRRWRSGMVSWYASEDPLAGELEKSVPPATLRAAVVAVSARPNGRGKRTSPVPALVREELEAMASRVARDADRLAAQAARESGPPPLPATRARERLANLQAALGRGASP